MYGNAPKTLLCALSRNVYPGVLWPQISSCGVTNTNQKCTAVIDTTTPGPDSGLVALRLVGTRVGM